MADPSARRRQISSFYLARRFTAIRLYICYRSSLSATRSVCRGNSAHLLAKGADRLTISSHALVPQRYFSTLALTLLHVVTESSPASCSIWRHDRENAPTLWLTGNAL